MRRKKSPKYTKRHSRKTILKRFIAVFCLVGFALILAKTIFTSMDSATNVLGEKIYLASNEENHDDQEEKQSEEEKRKQEAYKKQQENERQKYKNENAENPKVICIGPDGKKFKTTKKECEKISEMAGKPVELEIIPSPTPLPTKQHQPEIDLFIFEEEPDDQNPPPSNSQSTEQSSQSQPQQSVIEMKRTEPLPQTPIQVQVKESGETIDINAKDVKIELEQKSDGQIVVKAQQEDGTTLELVDSALFHIEERLAIDRIKIATTSAHEFLIQRNNTAAVTNFPLSWDLTTNSLIVTTPAGRKHVPVLPDQAVQNLVTADELDQAIIPLSLREDRNVHLGTILDIATLTHKNGIPTYKITGVKGQKLFGLFPVAIEKTVEVSGENGEILGMTRTPMNTIIDLISF